MEPEGFHRIYMCPRTVPILIQIDPIHAFPSTSWSSILILSFHLRQGLPGQWRNHEVCSGGEVQQIQLRTEGTENGDLGAVVYLVRGSAQFANEWNSYSY
jgi:hypothetical protein